MIAASRPRPAMTRKAWRRCPSVAPSPTCSSRSASDGSSVIQPTSTWRLRPVMATSTARPRSSVGSSRLRARRFPVPPGSRPIGTPVPTISWATARTVPSPPNAQTTSTPSASAARVWPKPTSCSSVSRKSGTSQPCSVQTRSMTPFWSEPSPSSLVGLTMTAIRFRGGASSWPLRKESREGRALACRPLDREDSSSQSPTPTRSTARAMPTQVHDAFDTRVQGTPRPRRDLRV